MSDIAAAVEAALEDLGTLTPAMIADRLQTEGIKAWRADALRCPVAQWVRSKVEIGPATFSIFENWTLALWRDVAAVEQLGRGRTPEQVVQFIKNFDAGMYPDLIKQH